MQFSMLFSLQLPLQQPIYFQWNLLDMHQNNMSKKMPLSNNITSLATVLQSIATVFIYIYTWSNFILWYLWNLYLITVVSYCP